MAELIKCLSEVNAVSGDEKNAREIILEKLSGKVDSVRVDSMGNIIALKRGADSSKTVAAAAHMDEAGFIISGITDKGYLKFKAVGNIDPRKIISKRVVIGDTKIKGVIGMKAIHLQTKTEREKVVRVSKLFIDIGAKNKRDAEEQVKLGSYVTFDTEFSDIGDNIKGKALERSGVLTALLDVLDTDMAYDTYICFIAQHEVGARGAGIVSRSVNPDVILTVSAVETEDMYGCENTCGAKLSEGAVISFADKLSITDRKLTQAMIKAAQNEKIPIQTKVLSQERSDTGAMQTASSGARCINLAIPCRYSRSPVSLMSKSDIKSAAGVIRLFFNRIGDMI